VYGNVSGSQDQDFVITIDPGQFLIYLRGSFNFPDPPYPPPPLPVITYFLPTLGNPLTPGSNPSGSSPFNLNGPIILRLQNQFLNTPSSIGFSITGMQPWLMLNRTNLSGTKVRSSEPMFSVTTSASGSGIVFGRVTDAETGEPVDNGTIQVKTSVGTTSYTQDGYFWLNSPAGSYTISAVDASGTYSPASASGSLVSGSTAKTDLVMYRAEGSKSCILEKVLEDDPAPIFVFRSFRERVLGRSAGGRQYVRAYYRFSGQMKQMLAEDEGLRSRVAALVLDLLPEAKKALKGEPVIHHCDNLFLDLEFRTLRYRMING